MTLHAPANVSGSAAAEMCPCCRSKDARIEALETQLEAALQHIDAERFVVPWVWQLGGQEAAFAEKLARGPVSRAALFTLLDVKFPADEPRHESHVSTVMRRLRKKLRKFGWVVLTPGVRLGAYRLRTDQQEQFTAALRSAAPATFTPTTAEEFDNG